MKGSKVLEALEDGKMVRCVHWPERDYWVKMDDEILGYKNGILKRPSHDINYVFDVEFEILHEYVTFDEAMKASLKGFTVLCHFYGDVIRIMPGSRIHSFDHGAFSFQMLSEAKWSIESKTTVEEMPF